MKRLHLVLKNRWFYLIEKGTKEEEYRSIRFHWFVRFFQPKQGVDPLEPQAVEECLYDMSVLYTQKSRHKDLNELMNYFGIEFKKFEFIEFQLGYAKDAERMRFEFSKITIGKAVKGWADDLESNFFVIHLGEPIK